MAPYPQAKGSPQLGEINMEGGGSASHNALKPPKGIFMGGGGFANPVKSEEAPPSPCLS